MSNWGGVDICTQVQLDRFKRQIETLTEITAQVLESALYEGAGLIPIVDPCTTETIFQKSGNDWDIGSELSEQLQEMISDIYGY